MAKRILFVGHGRHGKDTACEALAKATGWRNAGTTSIYLTPYVVAEYKKLGMHHLIQDAYLHRHRNRELWRRVGDEIRKDDPALLVRESLKVGDIAGGCRGLPEILAVRRESVVDLIVWVDASKRKPPDPTMEFGPEHADIIVDNNGTEAEFVQRLRRLGGVLL